MVGETMKRYWSGEMEVLAQIDRVCKKHGLRYYLYFGTLLGAVRHKGFIPWDDDLDIALLHEDYIKFMEIARSELPEGFIVKNAYTMYEHRDFFTRVENATAIRFDDDNMKEFHDCPFVAGVDVFPLYNAPRDKNEREIQRNLLRSVAHASRLCEEKETDLLAKELVELSQITGYEFDESCALITHLTRLFDQLSRLYTKEECDCVTDFYMDLIKPYEIPRSLYEKEVTMPFEGFEFPVPEGYDYILKCSFKDYMVPKIYENHHYPSYKEQVKLWGDRLELYDVALKQNNDNVNLIVPEKANCDVSFSEAKEELPEDWLNTIYYDDEGGNKKAKKVLLYYTGATEVINHSGNVIQKIRENLEVFKSQDEVVIWWAPCLIDNLKLLNLNKVIPETVRDFGELIESFKTEKTGILDDTGNMTRAFKYASAYYGDPSLFSDYYLQTKRPVMYQNYREVAK